MNKINWPANVKPVKTRWFYDQKTGMKFLPLTFLHLFHDYRYCGENKTFAKFIDFLIADFILCRRGCGKVYLLKSDFPCWTSDHDRPDYDHTIDHTIFRRTFLRCKDDDIAEPVQVSFVAEYNGAWVEKFYLDDSKSARWGKFEARVLTE